jgi:hypothetical protein
MGGLTECAGLVVVIGTHIPHVYSHNIIWFLHYAREGYHKFQVEIGWKIRLQLWRLESLGYNILQRVITQDVDKGVKRGKIHGRANLYPGVIWACGHPHPHLLVVCAVWDDELPYSHTTSRYASTASGVRSSSSWDAATSARDANYGVSTGVVFENAT